jgi:Aerotolerance regulator N-terminal/von Willebrand factor type A domain
MFLHPLMLAGLGGAVIPLLLHLLSRARYRDVEWGAMMFLAGVETRQRQSARLSQGLLLLIRMGIVAALAIALARPILQGNFEGGESGRVTALILLDCSSSMSFDQNGRTRFDLAQRAAEQILAALQPGDRVALIPMGVASEPADAEPTTDLRAVANRIEQLHTGWGSADLRDSLSRCADILLRSEKSNRDVYVVSDRQALNWQSVDDAFAAEWRKRMASSSDAGRANVHVRTFIVPVGTTDADNVAVEAVRLADPPAIRGQPVEIEVKIRNYSPAPRSDVPLILRVADHVLLQTPVSLPADQAEWFRFEQGSAGKKLIIPNAGSQILAAEITTAGYVADDRAESSIDVIEPIKVLLISGDSRAAAFQSETDFVRWALASHHAAGLKKDPDPCSVTVLAADAWEGNEIDDHQVVLIANVERFSPGQVQALERYVYDGGRVLIAPGSLSRIDDYNTQLYRDGAGILPGELQAPTPADGSEATSVLGYDATHSIFQFLRGKPDPIPSATIGRYFPAVARQTYAWPLAWYASGDPFLIEGSSERGRVILMTTSLDADWTTLPLSNFYLPFLQNAVRYLAANPAQRNLTPGQPIQLSFPDGDAPRRVWLTDPQGHRSAMDVVRFAQQAEIRTTSTNAIGEYRLEIEETGKTPYSLFYVVSPPLVESDLRQLTEARWKWLEQNLGVRRVEPTEQPLREVAAAGRSGSDLWLPLLALVLLLSTLEMAVSRWSSGGYSE